MVDVIISAIVGILTGGYSGLIVARYSYFCNIRGRVLGLIQRLEIMAGDNASEMTLATLERSKVELVYISSELFRAKHLNAGVEVSVINKEVEKAYMKYKFQQKTAKELMKDYARWQSMANSMRPNVLHLFTIAGL